MSTTRITEKPKRPLSGYNLFYRYKRSMVLEATSNFAEGVSSDEEKEVIGSVLNALPGLEGVPANHPVWSFPSHVRNGLRAANIRTALEGKLLPNENTRSRLHRKVHGMGFVEMGKIMRSMWADIDKFTKEVFSELADVGRVTYRVRLAEYKLQLNLGSVSLAEEETKIAPVMNVGCTSTATIIDLTEWEGTPKASKKPVGFSAFANPVSRYHRAMICQDISPTSPSYEKKDSNVLNSLEPISISPTSTYGRRVSNEIDDGDFSPDIVQQSIRACQEINGEFSHLLSSIPPPPLFQLDASYGGPRAFSRRRRSDWSNNSWGSSSDSELATSSSESEDGVETEDMLALIGDLDDALDSGGPSMIFGKPVHDVTRTPVSTRTA